MLEILLSVLKDVISGLIWGCAAFKFTHNKPEKDEARITATMFAVGCLFGVLPTAIIFALLVSDINTLKIFQKKTNDIINESDMELEELYRYQRGRSVKKSIKYFVCTYVVVMVCAFIFGIFIGILEYIGEMNNQYYQQQVKPQAPVYMEL